MIDDPDFRTWHEWFTAHYSVEYLNGSAGGRIRYARRRNREESAKVLVCVSGRTEFFEKYLETAYDLRDSGYSLVLYDHCGQGGSDRLLADREKGHIEDFSFYVKDLVSVIAAVYEAGAGRRTVLLGHSMGGTIATLALTLHPHLADGLILCAPMLQINTGRFIPPCIIEQLVRLICRLGGNTWYAWGTGPFDPDLPFRDNPLTGDAMWYGRLQRLMTGDNRRLALGGPTFGWLEAAYRAMRQARSAAGSIPCPVLLLQGLADRVVCLPEMDEFVGKLPQGSVQRFAGARHELLVEQKAIRTPALEAIVAFLTSLEGR